MGRFPLHRYPRQGQRIDRAVSPSKTCLFTEGKMFDGSSIAGWKVSAESDMILMRKPIPAVLDPLTDDHDQPALHIL